MSKKSLRLTREALTELDSSELTAVAGAEFTASCVTWTLACVTVGQCQITRTIVC